MSRIRNTPQSINFRFLSKIWFLSTHLNLPISCLTITSCPSSINFLFILSSILFKSSLLLCNNAVTCLLSTSILSSRSEEPSTSTHVTAKTVASVATLNLEHLVILALSGKNGDWRLLEYARTFCAFRWRSEKRLREEGQVFLHVYICVCVYGKYRARASPRIWVIVSPVDRVVWLGPFSMDGRENGWFWLWRAVFGCAGWLNPKCALGHISCV